MIDDVQLRNQVRVILSTRPDDETMPEPLLLAALTEFFGKRVAFDEMGFALQWNKARGWVETRWNDRYERTEWKLSERGRVKEGL